MAGKTPSKTELLLCTAPDVDGAVEERDYLEGAMAVRGLRVRLLIAQVPPAAPDDGEVWAVLYEMGSAADKAVVEVMQAECGGRERPGAGRGKAGAEGGNGSGGEAADRQYWEAARKLLAGKFGARP